MTELLLDVVQRLALLKEQAGERVPDVVESEPRDDSGLWNAVI
jgi:hypothetical protein